MSGTDDNVVPYSWTVKAAQEREAWRQYRIWEDQHFPLNEAHPLTDPPGMLEARRRFEKILREINEEG
jgi:hypothetical protein